MLFMHFLWMPTWVPDLLELSSSHLQEVWDGVKLACRHFRSLPLTSIRQCRLGQLGPQICLRLFMHLKDISVSASFGFGHFLDILQTSWVSPAWAPDILKTFLTLKGHLGRGQFWPQTFSRQFFVISNTFRARPAFAWDILKTFFHIFKTFCQRSALPTDMLKTFVWHVKDISADGSLDPRHVLDMLHACTQPVQCYVEFPRTF